MNQKINRIIGLDIGTYSIKIVVSILDNNIVNIERVISIPIPGDLDRTPDSIGKWLAEVWKGSNIPGKKVRLALPRYQALLTEMELPAGDDAETVQMLELQLERALPVPVDTVNSDYYLMYTSELGDRKIMVVSVKKEVVEFYTTLIRYAGLVLEAIDLSSLSISRSVQSAVTTMDSWMAVDIGYANSELIVVDRGHVVLSRSASIGTSTSGWVNKLFFELKRSFEGYAMEFGKAIPDKLVFCGGGSRTPELTKVLNEKLGGSNQIIDISASLGRLLHTEPEQAVNYTGAYGLVLAPNANSQSCNLLIPRLFAPVKRKMSLRYKQMAVGIGSAALIVLLLLGALYIRQRKLEQLKTEYGGYSALVAKSEQVNASTSLIRTWKQQQISILDILRELSYDWTDQTYLQVLSYDQTKDLSVTGLASSNQAVAELLMKLNKSPSIGDTKFTYIRSSKRNPSYPVEFGLSMKYKSSTTVSILPVSGRGQ